MITKGGPWLKAETMATYSRHRISQKKNDGILLFFQMFLS